MTTALDLLNSALIRLHRSLLQYVGECWPWSDDTQETEIRGVIEQAVAQQREHVARLARVLNAADYVVDYGVYPTEYTDLYYVSLKFLLKQLVQQQQQNIAELDRLAAAASGNEAAVELLQETLTSERQIGEKLTALTAPKLAVTPGT